LYKFSRKSDTINLRYEEGLRVKLGIVLFPSKELQEVANSYRKRYDPHYEFISPHLTLKEAFEASEEDLSFIISELRKIASSLTPFTLQCSKVSHFHPTNNVIYLAVEEDPLLTDLVDRVHEPSILKHERSYAFVPHITIGQGMADDELHDIYSRLRMQECNYGFKVDRFHLVYQLDNLTWNVHQTFSLGEDC
jgi:2'-5' RNA ligase